MVEGWVSIRRVPRLLDQHGGRTETADSVGAGVAADTMGGMPRIRQTDVEEVKARVNIADVVGEYVTLKSAGVGSLKGLCPFHD